VSVKLNALAPNGEES